MQIINEAKIIGKTNKTDFRVIQHKQLPQFYAFSFCPDGIDDNIEIFR